MGGMEQSDRSGRDSFGIGHHSQELSSGISPLDSYVDIFNILSASASKYVDSAGTYVRKLSLANYPYQLRATLGSHDPVIVLVDSEIEQAILAMAGDLSKGS